MLEASLSEDLPSAKGLTSGSKRKGSEAWRSATPLAAFSSPLLGPLAAVKVSPPAVGLEKSISSEGFSLIVSLSSHLLTSGNKKMKGQWQRERSSFNLQNRV